MIIIKRTIILILVGFNLISCHRKVVYAETYPHIIEIEENPDKSLLLYSWERILYKTDSIGNLVWTKSVADITNNTKYYCADFYYNTEGTRINFFGYFLTVDTTEKPKLNFGQLDLNGNNLEQKFEIEYDGTNINDMLFLSNDQWILASMNEIYLYDKTNTSLSKIYKLHYSNGQIATIDKIDNDNFLVSALKYEINDVNSYIFRFNKKGEIKWEKSYEGSDCYLTRLQDSTFIIDRPCETKNRNDICLAFIDKNGSEINHIKLELASDDRIKTILFDKMKCIYLIGHKWDSQNQRVSGLIIKYNSYGDKLFYRTYNYKGGKEFQSGAITSDNYLIIGGRNKDEKNLKQYYQDILLKLDLNCNVIWEKILQLNSEYK